jgi:hypothetical protein
MERTVLVDVVCVWCAVLINGSGRYLTQDLKIAKRMRIMLPQMTIPIARLLKEVMVVMDAVEVMFLAETLKRRTFIKLIPKMY